jgi:hypothetical protein
MGFGLFLFLFLFGNVSLLGGEHGYIGIFSLGRSGQEEGYAPLGE